MIFGKGGCKTTGVGEGFGDDVNANGTLPIDGVANFIAWARAEVGAEADLVTD